MPLHCQIITQERKVFDGEVDIVTAPGAEGQMGILPNHSPLVSALDFGELRVRQGSAEEVFAIGGGVLQVANNQVLVLADSAERADEIDLARAEAARRRAEKFMEEGLPRDAAAYAALEAAIRRARVRLEVGRKAGRRATGPGAMDFGRSREQE